MNKNCIKIIFLTFAISSYTLLSYGAKSVQEVPLNGLKSKSAKAEESQKNIKNVAAYRNQSIINDNNDLIKQNYVQSKAVKELSMKNNDKKMEESAKKLTQNSGRKPKIKFVEPNLKLNTSSDSLSGSQNQSLPDIRLNVGKDEKHYIKVSEPVKKIDKPLFDTDPEKVKQAFQIQKELDIEDIRNLWESTVERNAVIKFAIKKLAMPPEQRRIHSSLMAKTVSTLISGAAILPNMFGADAITSTTSLAGGSLANRILQNKTMPKQLPLTDTELIHLAGLIDDLQDRIIKSYYDYKSSVESLRVCRQNLLIQSTNYSNAIKSKNDLAIIASSSSYDKELYNELKLKQQIKLKRLELERLAGKEAVDNLNLTRITSFDVKENSDSSAKKSGNAAGVYNKGAGNG